jgi:uncharacterized protein
MMMCLGLFVFGMQTAAYQELQRQMEWKHQTTSRVGTRDAHQFTGLGEETITLSGWIAPELTGTALSLDALRFMADTGQSWILVQGTGRIYGSYVITNMTEGKTIFETNGDAKRIDFSITLKRIDEGVIGMLGSLAKVGSLNQLSDMMGLSGIASKVQDIASTVGGIAGSIAGRLP